MCILASPVHDVSNTSILVGYDLPIQRQLVVYEMSVALRTSTGKGNAMILPVPTSLDGASTISLIDLSTCPDFFKPFARAFEVQSRGLSKGIGLDEIEVVRMGSYDVSIVPTVDDVKRLNPAVFDVSEATEATLRTHYPIGFSFLVAQLRASGSFHPLAYTHPLLGGQMFVPTRHEHGKSTVRDLAAWDHRIYYLPSSNLPLDVLPRNRHVSRVPAVRVIDRILESLDARSAPIAPFLGGAVLAQIRAKGNLPNIDLTLPVPHA